MIASVGDLVLDVTVIPERHLRPDDDTPSAIRVGGGGQAANFCAWAAWLGHRSRLVCRTGDDDTGNRLVEELEGAGVEVRAVKGPDPTGVIAVLVGPDGERTMATQRGACIGLTALDLKPEWLDQVALLHLPAYSLFEEPLAGAADAAARAVRVRGGLVSVDLSSVAGMIAYGPERLVDRLRSMQPDLLFATAAEADTLGVPLDDLAPTAAVKLGPAGCQVGSRRITAPHAELVDPTGAGDAFAAAFCAATLDGATPVEAAERAVAVAAQAVGVMGGRPPRRVRA